MYQIIELSTTRRTELIDITDQVRNIIQKSKIRNGSVIIYVPHTTAAITINENYDQSVADDITNVLNRLFPHNYRYQHSEGNADAHIKAALIGSTRTIFIEDNEILFGTWQGIFFCEFDGPRKRKVFVKIIPDSSC
ncbi:MAG: secondary thiamine-phosphate synthase enzyme YjbQ [Candidatus Latescibacteria bacterium]|nr:secondary thiamine-phosphate synthase enzyme YjbQ [Candidatus Latescibacterota bacterium]